MIFVAEKRWKKRNLLDDDETPPSKKRVSTKTKVMVVVDSSTKDKEEGETEDAETEGESAEDAGSVATPNVKDHDSILDAQESASPVAIDIDVRYLPSVSSPSFLVLIAVVVVILSRQIYII